MSKEAMKLALEALGNSWTEPGNKQYEFEKEAITTLREALVEQPAQRKPLTDEQRMNMWRTTEFRGNGGQVDWFIEGTRAAEAAHGIKENT